PRIGGTRDRRARGTPFSGRFVRRGRLCGGARAPALPDGGGARAGTRAPAGRRVHRHRPEYGVLATTPRHRGLRSVPSARHRRGREASVARPSSTVLHAPELSSTLRRGGIRLPRRGRQWVALRGPPV